MVDHIDSMTENMMAGILEILTLEQARNVSQGLCPFCKRAMTLEYTKAPPDVGFSVRCACGFRFNLEVIKPKLHAVKEGE